MGTAFPPRFLALHRRQWPVWRIPNQTDSDVPFSRWPNKRKFTKKGLKDNCGRLIDFLSQISKLSYFNLLDLADFLMHHQFPVSFFDVANLHRPATRGGQSGNCPPRNFEKRMYLLGTATNLHHFVRPPRKDQLFAALNLMCAKTAPQPVLAICALFRASSSVGSSGGLIITAHTSPYLFCPPSSCTYITATSKN